MAARILLPSLVVALALAACASNKAMLEQRVLVTASGSAVKACTSVGPVTASSFDSLSDTPLQQMQKQVLDRGGNTLLVNSYATAESGTAWMCRPALDCDDPRVRPPQIANCKSAAPAS